MVRLEVAFDDVSVERCCAITDMSPDGIDIVEAGTLMLLREGLHSVRQLRRRYPDKVILADAKIIDAPEVLAGACIDAGADIVTVMASAPDATVRKVIALAHARGKEAFVDLLGVSDLESRAAYFDELGADYLCIHASKNEKTPPFEPFAAARAVVRNAKLAVAGGITTANIAQVMALHPDVVIVGSGIYQAEDPAAKIARFKEAMTQ